MEWPVRVAVSTALVLWSLNVHAFDYLEHSYFTDRACLLAQEKLATRGLHSEEEVARYLALALTCPLSWEVPYCRGGYKQAEGVLNRLKRPPAQSDEFSATLGDFAALPDHLAEFGAVLNIPQAGDPGLTSSVLGWLASPGSPGGVIEDVAEDGCETELPLDWARLEHEVVVGTSALLHEDASALPDAMLSPLQRSPLLRGVRDPAGAYSFDNPRFLDLVLQNHGHFGRAAHANWQGFQSTASDLAAARCESVLAADDDLLEDLSENRPAFENLDWDSLPFESRQARACALVGDHLRERIQEWSRRAPTRLVSPIQAPLAVLAGPDSAERDRLSRKLVPAMMGVVFVGSGLHFLQDEFSSGHLRVERAAHGLHDSRYHHDVDSANGLAAYISTAGRHEALVLFGDGYLLGKAGEADTRCPDSRAPKAGLETSACLLRRQRSWVLLSSAAALHAWATDATEPDPLSRRFLPLAPVGSDPTSFSPGARLSRGTLPNPPPPFSYQSLLLSTSIDASGGASEVGARMAFLSELGSGANWMTSYNFGLLTRVGSGTSSQALLEGAYLFHWRWAARFLLNAGPFAFVGLRDLGNDSSLFGGVGPSAGLTLLPEGWIRLPLEVTFNYRMPLRLYRARPAPGERAIGIEAHWVELCFGIAIM